MKTCEIPHPSNFCGGNFQDWIEVNLISACNGKCSWCVEKVGYHPTERATWEQMRDAALATGKTNIILLGGEPTLYPDIEPLITSLTKAGKRVWMTTNGSKLTKEYVDKNLKSLYGINVSIHHFDLDANESITGIKLDKDVLGDALDELSKYTSNIRFNCNCIKGAVDSVETIRKYIEFAKYLGATKVRFAELKFDEDNFVDLTKVLGYKYGLNDNPFKEGCNSDAVIDDMPVNFRQMCGLQTSRRTAPINPQQEVKEVLYYDGKVYKGWQTKEGVEQEMKARELLKLMNDVKAGKITPEKAAAIVAADSKEQSDRATQVASVGCQY